MYNTPNAVDSKEVMDNLFRGNITFQEAMEQMKVSEDELHRMIDNYEYTITTEDILEANRMMLENLDYIEIEIIRIGEKLKKK